MSKEELKKLASKFETELEKSAQQQEEEGWKRDKFIEKTYTKLLGGLGEFYKHRLALKNDEPEWKDKWLEEAVEHTGKVFGSYLESAKTLGKAKNYDNAYSEILELIKGEDQSKRDWATKEFKRDHSANPIEHQLDDKDAQIYRAMMDETYEKFIDENFDSPKYRAKKV